MKRTESHAAKSDDDLVLATRLLELWRVCGKPACKRARACRGAARLCCENAVAWSESLALNSKTRGFQQALQKLREARPAN